MSEGTLTTDSPKLKPEVRKDKPKKFIILVPVSRTSAEKPDADSPSK